MKIKLIIALTVFISSCSSNSINQEIDTNGVKVIRLVSSPDSIIANISDIVSEVEYIPLQKTTNSHIDVIDKIMIRRNKIYVSTVNTLQCFNNKGRYLYGLYGNAKGKVQTPIVVYDFDISSDDSKLIVLSSDKILEFNNTDTGFVFMKSIKLGSISPTKLDFVPGTNNILISSISVYGLHMLINIYGDTINIKPNYNKKKYIIRSGLPNEIIHFKFDNDLYFKDKFSDTVFYVDSESNKFTQSFIFDSYLSSTTDENINDPEYLKYLPRLVNVFEVSRYLFYTYTFINSFYNVFYDKYEDGKFEIDQKNGSLKDDISGGPNFSPIFCSEGKYISWISAKALKKYTKSEEFRIMKVKNPKKKENLEELATNLKEADNPVIIIVTPKE